MVSDHLISAVSTRSFPRVGQRVGQNGFRGFTKTVKTCTGVTEECRMSTVENHIVIWYAKGCLDQAAEQALYYGIFKQIPTCFSFMGCFFIMFIRAKRNTAVAAVSYSPVKYFFRTRK